MLVARSAVLSMTSEAMEEDEYEAVRYEMFSMYLLSMMAVF